MEFLGTHAGAIGLVIQTLAVVAAAAAALFSAKSSKAAADETEMARQNFELQDQTNRVSVLMDVSDRWTKVLPLLYSLRDNKDQFLSVRDRHDSREAFMASDEWKETLRGICNFYEFVGLLVHSGALRAETVMVIVTIHPDDRAVAGPAIDWLRGEYRGDIYMFWDWLVDHVADKSGTNPMETQAETRL